jgi:hypothetical protein
MDLEVGQLAQVKQEDIDWKEGKKDKEGKSLYFEGNMMVHYSDNKMMAPPTFVRFSRAL